MVTIKSPRELDLMRQAGRIVSKVFEALEPLCIPGNTTKHLESIADKVIRENGGKSEEFGYYGYPGVICTSVNEEVLHGIPSSKRRFKEGDIVSCDIVVSYKGYMADACRTFAVGKLSPIHEKLVRVTKECFFEAMKQVKVGAHVGDLSNAIQTHAEENGFSVIRDYSGHGIGTNMHEDPQIPCFGIRGTGMKLKKNMTIAVEPMVLEGRPQTRVLNDDWTVVTCDHKYGAHYENTIIITEDGYEIITLTDKEKEIING